MQIPLGQRLQVLAGFVPEGARVADIGSDHGYLPAWLVQNGRAARAIACEINRDPARRAQQTCSEYGLADRLEVRIGDGLDVVKPGEVDVVVVAGMGGTTIAGILQRGRSRLDGVARLILQPNVAAAELRSWLVANQFAITAESLVAEHQIIYEVIVAEPGRANALSPLERLLGPVLLKQRPALFRPFVERLIADRQLVLQQLAQATSAAAANRRQQFALEVAALGAILLEK